MSVPSTLFIFLVIFEVFIFLSVPMCYYSS